MKDQKLKLEGQESAKLKKGKEHRPRKAKLVQFKEKYKHARHWLEDEEEDENDVPFHLRDEEE